MKTIVNKAGGVYTVFIDPMTGKSVRKDDPISQSCVTSTMLKIDHVYKNFGGADNVEIIDFDPPPSKQETVDTSESDIQKYINQNIAAPHVSSLDKDLLQSFKEGCLDSKWNKQYVNGMAHIVLSINPLLKDDLVACVKTKKVSKINNLF